MEIEKTIKPVMDHTVADAILDAEKAKEYCKKSCDEKGLTKAVKEVVAENQPDSHDETVKDVSEAEAVITESCKVEEDTYMLKPEFDSRKSFYKKAKVIDEDGVKLLYSYSTPVCAIIEGEGVVLLENPHGYYRLGYDASPTTLRHVREFLKQNGFEVYPVAQLPLHYPVENFTSLDDLKARAIIGAEDVELQEGKETSQDILYLKDRKDLAEAISCCKKDGRKFRVTRTCKEGYRYELVKEPIEVLKDLIDITTTDDTAVISEKGQTENPDAPKIEVEISAEDKEILDTTFAASEETAEESEPQEDADIEEIEIEDEEDIEDDQLDESLRSDKPTVGDLVEFLRDTADELEMNYDSDTKIKKVSNTYFLGNPNFFLGISGSYTGGFINLDSPVDEEEEYEDSGDDQLDDFIDWYENHYLDKDFDEKLNKVNAILDTHVDGSDDVAIAFNKCTEEEKAEIASIIGLKEGISTSSKAKETEEDIEDEEIGDLTSGIFSLGDLSDEDLDDLDKNTIEPTIDIPGEDSESVFEYLVNLYDLYLAEPESLTTGEIALLKKQGLISDEEYEDGGDDLPVDFKNISSDPTFGLEDDDFDAAELQEEKVVCDPEDTCCGEPNCEHKHNACHDDSCDDECCDDTCKTELESDSTSKTDIEWPEDDEVIEAPVKTETTIELPNDTVEVEQKENKIEIEITPKETEEDDIVADDTVEDDLLEMASSYINYIKK